MSHIYKIFTKILTRRIEKKIDEALFSEQAGFRSNHRTTDHIHTENMLREKCRDFNLPTCLIFVDFEKAFDSVEFDAIMKSLIYQGIELQYIHLLKDIYSNCTSNIALNEMKTTFDINKGVRQGDTISPKLFTNCLEYIFRNINWDTKGININGEILHRLKFADDIVLISDNLKNTKSMLDDLHKECIKCGLRINMSKTKLMYNPKISHAPIQLRGETIQLVQNYVYLGQNICLQDTNQTMEINRRIRLGWATFGKLNSIMKGDLPICLKTKEYNQRVIPTITYGSETWTTSQKMENKIRTTQRAMEMGNGRNHKKRQMVECISEEQDKSTGHNAYNQTSKWRWAGCLAKKKQLDKKKHRVDTKRRKERYGMPHETMECRHKQLLVCAMDGCG